MKEFLEEKLTYILIKSMRSLANLHKLNILYGDMKPSNLLITEDYRIKIGDFGTAIELKGSGSSIFNQSIKAYTQGFIKEDFEKKVSRLFGVKNSEVISNCDYYGLFRTFLILYNVFKSRISIFSPFY